MDEPLCVDGTTDHTWVADSVSKLSTLAFVLQCMVCGAKAVTVKRPVGEPFAVSRTERAHAKGSPNGQIDLRYARPPRWGFAGLPPDDMRPGMPPQPTEPPPVELPPLDMERWKRNRGRD
jgi:hypothetical protein